MRVTPQMGVFQQPARGDPEFFHLVTFVSRILGISLAGVQRAYLTPSQRLKGLTTEMKANPKQERG